MSILITPSSRLRSAAARAATYWWLPRRPCSSPPKRISRRSWSSEVWRQDAGDLQNAGRAAAVVVGARRSGRDAARQVDRIEVGGDQHQPPVAALAGFVGHDVEAGGACRPGSAASRTRSPSADKPALAQSAAELNSGQRVPRPESRRVSPPTLELALLRYQGHQCRDGRDRCWRWLGGLSVRTPSVSAGSGECRNRPVMRLHRFELARRQVDGEVAPLVDEHPRPRETRHEGVANLYHQIEVRPRVSWRWPAQPAAGPRG